jgi:hypothetical protein
MSLQIDTSQPDQLKIRFVLNGSHPAGQVSVVGTFNNWTPGLDELMPNEDGTRSVTLGLPYRTRHVFRYLGPGENWFDEPDADEISGAGSVLRPRVPPA